MPENRKTQERLDPRKPLVFDTREVGRRPGSMKRLRRPVPVPEDLALDLVRVPAGATLDLDMRLESVLEGVLVSTTVTVPIEGECGRCLEPFQDSVEVDIQELYAYPHSETDDTTDEDEVSRLQGDLLDLEPALRDAVVLALPTNPLCRDDCPGLCPDCGVHWDDLPPEHSHDVTDPRWAALQSMREPASESTDANGAHRGIQPN
jgi:DUF177 domain-containing protein